MLPPSGEVVPQRLPDEVLGVVAGGVPAQVTGCRTFGTQTMAMDADHDVNLRLLPIHPDHAISLPVAGMRPEDTLLWIITRL
jgi:hypothetical protein